jgi:hypothetical protein
MKKTTAKNKPYRHAPAYARTEIKRLRSLGMRFAYNPWDDVKSVSHITPRAYCIAKPASQNAVFAVPLCDQEPQMHGLSKADRTTVSHESCRNVKEGDWCSLAYVSTDSSGQPVVLEILQPAKP